ncbi:MAG: DUF3102 domain-containing protein [Isosphaeraceae bacterium]
MDTITAPAPRRPRTPRTPAPLCSPTRPPAPSPFVDPDAPDHVMLPVCAAVREADALADDLPTASTGEVNTDRLACDINRAHRDGRKLARKAVQHAREAGGLLLQAKEIVGHGRFQAWITRNCAFSYSLAAKYMRIAERWDRVVAVAGPNMERVPDLSLRVALELIADPARGRRADASTSEDADVAPEADGPSPAASTPPTLPAPAADPAGRRRGRTGRGRRRPRGRTRRRHRGGRGCRRRRLRPRGAAIGPSPARTPRTRPA